jgi:hypothetical protein
VRKLELVCSALTNDYSVDEPVKIGLVSQYPWYELGPVVQAYMLRGHLLCYFAEVSYFALSGRLEILELMRLLASVLDTELYLLYKYG